MGPMVNRAPTRLRYHFGVGRTAFVLFLANAAIIASWLMLRAVWFDGSISCDDALASGYDQCSDRADLLVALGISAITLLAGSLLTLAAP